MFSLAPLLIITIALASLVLTPDAVQSRLDEQLDQFLGPQGAEAVQAMIAAAAKPVARSCVPIINRTLPGTG